MSVEKLWLYYCLNKTGTVVESIANTFTAICVLNIIDWHLIQDYNICYILNVFRLLRVKGHWIQKLWNQQLILVFPINLLVNLKARPWLHPQVHIWARVKQNSHAWPEVNRLVFNRCLVLRLCCLNVTQSGSC